MINSQTSIPSELVSYYDGNRFVGLSFREILSLHKQNMTIPGIYSYWNTKNNNYYVGQSNNIFRRLACHLSRLNSLSGNKYLKANNKNPRYKDFYNYGEHHFLCGLINMVNNKKLRIQIEREIINKFNPLYNKRNSDNGRILIKHDGFGESLKTYRDLNNITQQEISNISGVSASQISRLETGSSKYPSKKTADKIVSALGVTLNDIMRE